ncbi:predicted protein [Nematostella vectensis]|uniref:Ribonuclease H2 subunit B n=1 Tax=Nematostella vectensis TaxID=45351 RepID=A7RQZ3_NEMVE|nr:predicted protein [Nematostella vectensis]|eukprot:XP_001638086.1 predicted protein [Nematostella vectensis]
MPKARASKSAKANKPNKDVNQWIMLAPDDALSSTPESESPPLFAKIPHPRTGKGVQLLFSSDEKSVCEVAKFKDEPRSWFIDDTVHEDGSMVIATPIDSVFLCLPYLEKCSSQFRTLDQILIDSKFPSVGKLTNCITHESLTSVCDCKGDDDLHVYRINEDKTMAWLKTKVECVADYLATSDINVSKGSQSATFVRSRKHSDVTREDHLRYSSGMICDYLSLSWEEKLKKALNLPEKDKEKEVSDEEPPSKRVKLEEGSETVEDYSKEYEKLKSKIPAGKTPGKMTAGQRALSKVDKTGMKSISSFFGGGKKTSKK